MAAVRRSISGAGGASFHPPNHFDLLRFIAASCVLLAHSVLIFGGAGAPFARAMEPAGGVGVAIFFSISGYLVTASWRHHPRPLPFLRNRALRIFPALAVCVAVSVFVLGPSVSALPASVYFRAPETYRYLLNAALYTGVHGLPGVFTDHPCPILVNGSLWTLPMEGALYLAVLAMGRARLLQRGGVTVALLALAGLVLADVSAGATLFAGSIPLARVWRFGLCFFTGAALRLWDGRVRYPLPGLAAAGILCMVAAADIVPVAVAYLALPYLVIGLGRSAWRPGTGFARHGDFSYGMYLYGFPVAQALEPALRGSPWVLCFAVSYLLTLGCGVLSWHLVEKHALRAKA